MPRLDRRSRAGPAPARLDQLAEQQDQLGVEARVVGAERLGVHLRELAKAPGLRRLVAKERAPGPDLDRLGQLVHAVLDVGPADRGGRLRAQRQRAPGLVVEGEHLLLDDVRGLPDPAGEHLGVLEHRGLERLVARAGEQLLRAALQLQAAAGVRGLDVERAPGGLELCAHRASSARNGLLARSAPRLVRPMWPGYTAVSAGSPSTRPADRLEQRVPVAARQVGAAHRALEQHVAGEDRRLGRDRERHVARAVAGREQDVDLEAGQLELLAARERVLGVVGLERPEARPGHERHDVGEHPLLDLGHPHLRAGGLRHGRHGAHVVEVRVGEQDPVERHAEGIDRAEQLVGLVARVDDQRAVRAVAAEDVRVLGHRADGEHAHFHVSVPGRRASGGSGRSSCR